MGDRGHLKTSHHSCFLQTADEQRERQAFEASMQQLPAGTQAQKAHAPTGVCHVCFIEDYTDDNLLLEVAMSLTFVNPSPLQVPFH